MADESPSPARRAVEAQINSPRFITAVDRGRWKVICLAWPHLYVRVTGSDPESGQSFSHDFRLECEGFPDPGPQVERWAYEANPSCGQRPAAPTSGSPGYMDAMKEWDGSIYRAWSRTAAGHGDWALKRPDEAWHRNRDLTFIMEQLYALVSEQAVWLAARAA